MARVLVAMSGGVDSSVCAALLKEQGHECVGATMRLVDCDHATKEAADAKKVCDHLGIEHVVVDETAHFNEKVIKEFVKAYEDGLTPNPCIFCNKNLKFGRLIALADELNCDFMATGHYAQVIRDEQGQAHVLKSPSSKKDQSYVLWPVPQETLKRVILPLGLYETKDEVREKARAFGLVTAAKSDSQDICFIPNGHYHKFLQEFSGKTPQAGPIVDEFGETIGTHRGLESYTLGQRKGVGVSAKRKIYVTGKDSKTNTLFVGANDLLYTYEFFAREVNWSSGVVPSQPVEAQICATYQGKLYDCVLHPLENNRMRIELKVPMRAVCPGQSCVAYVGNELVCGGFIEEPPAPIRTALQEALEMDLLGFDEFTAEDEDK